MPLSLINNELTNDDRSNRACVNLQALQLDILLSQKKKKKIHSLASSSKAKTHSVEICFISNHVSLRTDYIVALKKNQDAFIYTRVYTNAKHFDVTNAVIP